MPGESLRTYGQQTPAPHSVSWPWQSCCFVLWRLCQPLRLPAQFWQVSLWGIRWAQRTHPPTVFLSGGPWQLHPQQPYLSHVQVGSTVTCEGASWGTAVSLSASTPGTFPASICNGSVTGMGAWRGQAGCGWGVEEESTLIQLESVESLPGAFRVEGAPFVPSVAMTCTLKAIQFRGLGHNPVREPSH